jgi:hypothetical protein
MILTWPFAAAGAQDFSPAELDSMPGLAKEPKKESVTEAVQRPDSQKIIWELSALRLSSKQEERLVNAIGKKAKEFDKLKKEYDKTAAEEEKWRSKADEQRQGLLEINQTMPDVIKEYLDEEQRQSYNAMLDAKNKPAPKEAPAVAESPVVSDEISAPAPVKKRRVLRKKRRLPVPAKAAGAIPMAPGTAAAVPAEDEPGRVMVDKEQNAQQPARKKRRVLRKKTAAQVDAPADDPALKEDIMANEPADAASIGKQSPAEEDAGSYP